MTIEFKTLSEDSLAAIDEALETHLGLKLTLAQKEKFVATPEFQRLLVEEIEVFGEITTDTMCRELVADAMSLALLNRPALTYGSTEKREDYFAAIHEFARVVGYEVLAAEDA